MCEKSPGAIEHVRNNAICACTTCVTAQLEYRTYRCNGIEAGRKKKPRDEEKMKRTRGR